MVINNYNISILQYWLAENLEKGTNLVYLYKPLGNSESDLYSLYYGEGELYATLEQWQLAANRASIQFEIKK